MMGGQPLLVSSVTAHGLPKPPVLYLCGGFSQWYAWPESSEVAQSLCILGVLPNENHCEWTSLPQVKVFSVLRRDSKNLTPRNAQLLKKSAPLLMLFIRRLWEEAAWWARDYGHFTQERVCHQKKSKGDREKWGIQIPFPSLSKMLPPTRKQAEICSSQS